jgi:hypothetical protein
MVPVANVFNVLALIAVFITAALHWYGIELSLYWTIPWWDVFAHFFGGLTIGLWAAAVAIRLRFTSKQTLIFLLVLAGAVGIGWEAWEAVESLSGGPLDTIKDLYDDVLGSAAAWVLYKLLYKGGRMW